MIEKNEKAKEDDLTPAVWEQAVQVGLIISFLGRIVCLDFLQEVFILSSLCFIFLQVKCVVEKSKQVERNIYVLSLKQTYFSVYITTNMKLS